MPASPFAIFPSASRFKLALSEPVKSASWVPSPLPCRVPACAKSPRSFSIVLKCCDAKTSVGASSAACPPDSITESMARSAITVLPEPTSPCSKRCIGCGCCISLSISLFTSIWPLVYLNGNFASNTLTRPSVEIFRGVASSSFNSALRPASNS